jgi:hypothetical protein
VKSRKYAEKRGRWFILSALHGLVAPDTVIEPYDYSIRRQRVKERQHWAWRVRVQMKFESIMNCRFVALAGSTYVKPFAKLGLEISQPMQGLSIGRQLQWLNQSIAADDRESRLRLAAGEG